MARGTREVLLTKADQGIADIGRAVVNLQTIRDLYGDKYPEYRDVCQVLIDSLEAIALQFITFRKQVM